ncbi:DNA-binding protein [Methanoculleus taiwanensis]|uniref:UPF0251 protein ABH15_11120 n=1 Tax=Methanoculleus taiwanensis TaxID=1550565 RepID=A0A498GYV9_9EURY|nr:DUF134 domain-containing protein [Methanoculleus taiwanensis]RXE55314.1 DNA-binding protein [Methanoculleus taiwanensis]
MSPEGNGCCRKQRGRPRVRRTIAREGTYRCFAPLCPADEHEGGTVMLLPEEVEVLRLIDLEGLDQEQAAALLGVSRKTAWRDLHEARRKVADALLNGKTLGIAGCARRGCDTCPHEDGGGDLP